MYLLHSKLDQLCEVSASEHFQKLHANKHKLSTFVYPEQGKHELLQETALWKVRPTLRVLLTMRIHHIGAHVSNALLPMNHVPRSPR